MDTERAQVGEVGVLRESYRGRVYSGRPGYVVSDEGTHASLYFPWNTVCLWPFRDGQWLRVPTSDWELRSGSWLPYEQLHVMELGAIHHVSVLWRPHGMEPAGWKVDFHEPLRRIRRGFEALDWALDVAVAPDRTYRLKDEDEFKAYQERGLLTREQADDVYRALERIISQIAGKQGPFADSIFDWRPDPSWHAVSLPEGWDTAALTMHADR